MLYYRVDTMFFDDGEVSVSQVKTLEGDKMPENSVKGGSNCDVYCDYFKSKEAAEKFRREALNA